MFGRLHSKMLLKQCAIHGDNVSALYDIEVANWDVSRSFDFVMSESVKIKLYTNSM